MSHKGSDSSLHQALNESNPIDQLILRSKDKEQVDFAGESFGNFNVNANINEKENQKNRANQQKNV